MFFEQQQHQINVPTLLRHTFLQTLLSFFLISVDKIKKLNILFIFSLLPLPLPLDLSRPPPSFLAFLLDRKSIFLSPNTLHFAHFL
jgi:hypothetical protein